MVRKIFTIIAVFSVCLNLVMDVRQYHHLQASHEINDWVNQSRRIVGLIDKMIISAVESSVSGNWPSLSEQIPALYSAMGTNSSLSESLSTLKGVFELPLSPTEQNLQAIKILNEMRSREEGLLNERIERERQENIIADNWIMQANLLDIFLISLMVFFFWYERLTNKRMQAYLTQSIERLNSVNEVLQSGASKNATLLKTAVHDLKNPLGSIRGFAELIHHEASSRSVVEMSEVIQRISNDTLNLVSSLLKQEQALLSPDALQLIDLNQQLAEVCHFLLPIAEGKKQKIEFKKSDENCLIQGDGRRLQDAFFNLIGNGLKFSPRGSMVTIQCQTFPSEVEICIRDQGPGFSREDIAKAFQPGQSLSAKPTGNETSNGIGLFSAKQSIELHLGQIHISNNPEGGACFTVKLPRMLNIMKEPRPYENPESSPPV